ncbi:MAG: HepT-like ribonuclease domain-containing protein [Planctomycetota bacterium]
MSDAVADDGTYLLHIRECMRRVQDSTAGGKEAFWENLQAQDAVLRNLQTLGESSQRLPKSLKDKRPEIDWRAIGSFRNILVHDYLGVNLDEVWEIVTLDLPKLRVAILALSAELGLPPEPPVRAHKEKLT